MFARLFACLFVHVRVCSFVGLFVWVVGVLVSVCVFSRVVVCVVFRA